MFSSYFCFWKCSHLFLQEGIDRTFPHANPLSVDFRWPLPCVFISPLSFSPTFISVIRFWENQWSFSIKRYPPVSSRNLCVTLVPCQCFQSDMVGYFSATLESELASRLLGLWLNRSCSCWGVLHRNAEPPHSSDGYSLLKQWLSSWTCYWG